MATEEVEVLVEVRVKRDGKRVGHIGRAAIRRKVGAVPSPEARDDIAQDVLTTTPLVPSLIKHVGANVMPEGGWNG